MRSVHTPSLTTSFVRNWLSQNRGAYIAVRNNFLSPEWSPSHSAIIRSSQGRDSRNKDTKNCSKWVKSTTFKVRTAMRPQRCNQEMMTQTTKDVIGIIRNTLRWHRQLNSQWRKVSTLCTLRTRKGGFLTKSVRLIYYKANEWSAVRPRQQAFFFFYSCGRQFLLQKKRYAYFNFLMQSWPRTSLG